MQNMLLLRDRSLSHGHGILKIFVVNEFNTSWSYEKLQSLTL